MRFVKEPEYFLNYRINKSCLAKAKPECKKMLGSFNKINDQGMMVPRLSSKKLSGIFLASLL